MPTDSLTVVPIFAAPFAAGRMPDADALNETLAAWLIERAVDEHRDPRAPPDPGRFESVPDLFRQRHPALVGLREFLLGMVGRSIVELGGGSSADAAALRLQARAWSALIRPDGAVPARSHPMASWCAVYCVQAGDTSAERVDAGSLRLHDPRLGNVYLDAGNSRLRMPYGHGHFGARLVPGQAFAFPACLRYEIAPLNGTGARPLVLVFATFRAEFAPRHES